MNTLTLTTAVNKSWTNDNGKTFYKGLNGYTLEVPAAIEAAQSGISVWNDVEQRTYDNYAYECTCQLTPWPVGMTKTHASVQSFLDWFEDEYCPDNEHTHHRAVSKCFLGGLEMKECSPYNSEQEERGGYCNIAKSVKFIFPYECNADCFTTPMFRPKVAGDRTRRFFFIPAKYVTVVSHHDRDVFNLTPEGKAMMAEKITPEGRDQIARIIANNKSK